MNLRKIITIIVFYILLLNQVSASIFISEILPNTDDDKNLEYIQITNSGNLDKTLCGYLLKDKSDKEFIFGSGEILKANSYKKYFREETKILLNNSDEELFLYDNSGSLVDSFSYESSEKGKIIKAFHENSSPEFEETSPPTPLLGGVEGSSSGSLTPPSIPPLQGEGSGTGNIASGSGIIENGSGNIDYSSGIIDNTGSIDNGTGSIIIPEINIEIQSGLEYLTGSIYKCKKDDCKINLNIEKIFTGTFLKNDYLCKWDFGTGAIFSTGTEEKCNPGYVDYGSGIFEVIVKVYEKNNLDNFGSGGLVVENMIIKTISSTYILGGGEVSNDETPPSVSPLTGEGSSTGSIGGGSGGVDNNSGSIDYSSGIFDNTGIIDEGTGSIIPSFPQKEGIQGGGLVLSSSGEINSPEVKYSFQRPTYFIEEVENLSVYNCDRTKEECKLNLDLGDTFSGSFKESDYNCFIDFGFGTGNLTGEENKCNPNTIIISVGTFNLNFKIENKSNTGIFSTGSFDVINKGFIKPVKITGSSNSSSGNGGNSITPDIYIKTPEIIIQSGLDENNKCNKIDCKINLNYIPENSKERCLWDFGGGIFETKDTDKNCNPGYVKYGTGNFEVKLKVYEKDREYNYKESILKFENIEEKPLSNPQGMTQGRPLLAGEGIKPHPSLLLGEEREQEFKIDIDLLKDVEIYKVMPNPKGNDNLEYIELKNNGNKAVNLKGCSLDDKLDGGSRVYNILDDDIILPGKKKRFYKTQTKLNLNNDTDEVNFYCGENEIDRLERGFGIASGYYLDHSRLDIISGKALVLDVIDGDTIKIKFLKTGKIETLRLIGVDTPETKYPEKEIQKFGIEAYNFTSNNLLGKQIDIEIDKNNFRDKYSRLLGFVFISQKNFNEKLIELGYARAYLKYSFKYSYDFEKAEKNAKNQKLGIWKENEEVKEFLSEKILKEEEMEEMISLVDENGNGIPDEFEELEITLPSVPPLQGEGSNTGNIIKISKEHSLEKENIEGFIIDKEKSIEKYRNFVVSGFSVSVSRLKSGLKISGKTVPNSEVFIRLKKQEISYLELFIPKASADYFYSVKSDEFGNYKFLLTDISSGDYILETKIKDKYQNEFEIEKTKNIELKSDYIKEMKTYVYDKQLKEIKKYSDEVEIALNKNKTVKNKNNDSLKNEKLKGIISVQGRLGTKKIEGNNIYCSDTCNINFDGSQSKGNISKYFWDFGNGEKFEGKNPKYVKYETPGNYKVILDLVGKNGEKTSEIFNVYFNKKTTYKKVLDDLKNKNILIEVTDANSVEEKNEENNNGNLIFFLILIVISFLVLLLLRREKII